MEKIIASADTHLFKALPESFRHYNQHVVLVANHARYTARAVFKFLVDVGNIVGAKLRLHYQMWGINDPVGKEVALYVLPSDWIESEASWNNKSEGIPWTTPGGDIGTLIDYVPIPEKADNYGYADAWMEWDVTNFTVPVFSVMVKFDTEYDGYIYGKTTEINFSSHEGRPEWQPHLLIETGEKQELTIPLDEFSSMVKEGDVLVIT